MKKIILAFTILLIVSCSSEYSESIQKANVLEKEFAQLENLYAESNNIFILQRMSEIKKEIEKLAEISGNKEQFLKNFKFINS